MDNSIERMDLWQQFLGIPPSVVSATSSSANNDILNERRIWYSNQSIQTNLLYTPWLILIYAFLWLALLVYILLYTRGRRPWYCIILLVLLWLPWIPQIYSFL